MKKVLAIIIIYTCVSQWTQAQVSGIVFRDFNANGTKDNTTTFNEPFLAGVTVKAYDANNAEVGSTSSDASGAYSFMGLMLPLRIEFSGYQIGDYPAPAGSSSSTSVQFYTVASSAANFGVNYPNDYCQSNPLIVTPRLVAGNADGDALLVFPYDYLNDKDGNINKVTTSFPSRDNTDGLDPVILESTSNIGAIHGVAWDKVEKAIYSGAFIKRKTKLGPLGNEAPGAIYKTDIASGTTTLFTTLSAGNNPHPIATTNFNDDYNTVQYVYKRGIGDLEISNDNSYLFAINLFDKNLYKINIQDQSSSVFDIPTTGVQTAIGGTCPASDVRPFALGKDKAGNIYVGGVCSAQTNQNPVDLSMYVWKFDGSSFSLIVNEKLDYERNDRQWNPWKNLTDTDLSTLPRYPMPQVGDIEFDIDGSMIIGLIDRFGDITPRANVTPQASPFPRTGGDILRLCFDGANYNLENAASCGGITTTGISPTGEFTPFGPGDKEYYFEDTPGDSGVEAPQGALLLIPGKNEVVTTAYDAVTYIGNGTRPEDNFNTGGLQKYSNTTGEQTGSYDIYLDSDVIGFGKTHGLGDIEALCSPAPLEIGNRVWNDTNSNGIQDAGEAGIDGVTVELYEGTTLVGTTTTANGGQWYFNNSNVNPNGATQLKPNTAYTIRVPSAAFPSGQTLTDTNTDGTTNGDLRDSDATLVSGNAEIAYTTGTYGQNDHTLDVGFKVACNLSASTTGNETNVSCNGGNNGAVGVTVSGNLVPVTYLWSNGATTGSITSLTAGTYTVTVTETPTCTAVASYTVTEPTLLDATCTKTDATTIGGNQGTASTSATGGTAPYTYLWSNGETTQSISNLTAGTYGVTVTDLNGCTANCMVTVQEPSCNLSATATGTNVLCNAGIGGTATATASGNLVPVTYLWSNGATTQSISNLTAGTYNVTVTEAPTCTAVTSYTVTEPTLLDAACSKTDVTTGGGADGTASTSATGGTAPYTYLWSNGETTESISGLTADTYSVTITDANGCTANCSVTIQEPGCNLSATTVGNETNVSCNGGNNGAVGVTASGNLVPVTYLWSNGATTQSISNLTAGTYTVTVTETPTCTAVTSYQVTEPTLLDATCTKTDVTTSGGADGTASTSVTGGTAPYTYLWSNGATTASITGLTAGTYTVTVTDLNGCTANCSVTVQEPGCNLSATTTGNETNVSCNGGNNGAVGVTASGNLVPVTYLWSNNETTQSISNLTAGTYTVTVTETPACTAVTSYQVTEPTLLDATCTKTDVTTSGGADGTASTSVTGGTAPYTYLWSNGATTASITGLTAGTYTVTATDANGCTAICSSIITQPNALPDLSLVKTVNSSIATIGSTVTFTITVSNDNAVDATGVVVTDYMPTGLSFVSSSDPANVTNNSGTISWNIGNFAGTDAPKVLTITATVNAAANNATTGEGVHINKAEITAMNEIDIDSTPNNDVAGEDDIDEVCLSVPIDLCNFPTSGITITSGAGQTSYQWYYSTDGISYTIMTGETNQTLNVTVQTIGNLQTGATQMYFKAAYNGNAITGGCGNTMCCPVIISIVNCCQPNKCINIGIVKH